MTRLFMFASLLLCATSSAFSQNAPAAPLESPAKLAEPGLTYGTIPDLPLPKTILFSAGPDEIITDAEDWARNGVSAFFLDFVARAWSTNIWGADEKPWTIGASDESFQKVAAANEVCRRTGSETFLKIAYDHPFEWFNDTAWQHIDHNFRQFAIFARDTQCTGIALDIEYINDQYAFDWPGYTYDGYTRADLIQKVRERMTRILQIMYDEFPNMVFLTFPESGLTLGTAIHTAWVEEAARRDAPGGIHYCTEYTYRNPNINYMFGHAAASIALFNRLLSEPARDYWTRRCSIAEGVWPFGFDYQTVYEPGMPLEEFRQAYAASLMASSRYNWIYSHNCRRQILGRDLDKYTGTADLPAYLDVIHQRQVVTDPKYTALARELRAMTNRDYAPDLGLVSAVTFMGPKDVPSLRLAPDDGPMRDTLAANWEFALRYYQGEPVDLPAWFKTQTHWMVLGPFPSDGKLSGNATVFPPETRLDLAAEYDGLEGKIRWTEYIPDNRHISVDLTRILKPTEKVTAYAVCFVTSPTQRDVCIRLGTNDAAKLWVDGKLLFDYPFEGATFLDREAIPVTLRQGTSPILLKITNALLNWGFVFRITGNDGNTLDDLRYTLYEPK